MSISKANALNYSMVFWDEVFEEIRKEYPNVETYPYLVDAASLYLVSTLARFEIVVTSNLFGDIVTDIGAAITGGMGLATGANVNPEKEFPSMFEPVHGLAPDISRQGIANPLFTIWSVSQMMDYFSEETWDKVILDTIEDILNETDSLTPDLGGKATISGLGDRFIELLKANALKILILLSLNLKKREYVNYTKSKFKREKCFYFSNLNVDSEHYEVYSVSQEKDREGARNRYAKHFENTKVNYLTVLTMKIKDSNDTIFN